MFSKMKYIIIGLFLGVIHHSAGNVIPNKLGECSRQGAFCDSCNSVAMCVETDYGMMKQTAFSCTGGKTCHNGECITKNPFCDRSIEVPFQCHVPGAFPDPFDCQSYHYCVVVGQNETDLILEDFQHKCQDDDSGQKWAYDAGTNFCSELLPADGVCRKWPVPLCYQQGQNNYLEENESIYYICQSLHGLLYPHLYACPHGSKYYPDYQKCGVPGTTTPTPTQPSTTDAPSSVPSSPASDGGTWPGSSSTTGDYSSTRTSTSSGSSSPSPDGGTWPSSTRTTTDYSTYTTGSGTWPSSTSSTGWGDYSTTGSYNK